jgi:hypothetical protein
MDPDYHQKNLTKIMFQPDGIQAAKKAAAILLIFKQKEGCSESH